MRIAPRLTRSVFLLAATSLFADISTEMLYPILPLFLTLELGAPVSIVGVVEGVAQATQYTAQGFAGWFADRLGRYKPIALLGYGMAALAKPAIGLAAAWPAVLAGRFVDRLGTGLRSTPRDALIAAAAGDAQRGAAFGLEGAGDNLGAVVGPLLGAGLLFLLQVNLRWIFYAALVPGLLTLVLIAMVPEATQLTDAATPSSRLSPRSLPSGYWRYLVGVAVFGLGNLSSAFIILKAVTAGLPNVETVLIYAGVNFVAAAISYPAGALSDRLGRKAVFLAGLAFFVVASLGLAVAGSGVAVGLFFAVYGAYQGIFRSTGKALATDLAPAERRASAIGFYSGTIGVTALLASLIGGQLWVRLGPSATFFYGAAFGLIGWVLLTVLVSARPSKATESNG